VTWVALAFAAAHAESATTSWTIVALAHIMMAFFALHS